MLTLFLILTAPFTTPASAQEGKSLRLPPKSDFSALQMTTVEQVAEVIDPLRLRLQNGTIIQLSGIDIPDLTPYDSGEIGMAALAFLKTDLLHKQVRVYQRKGAKEGRTNRMGYDLAHLEEKIGEQWIQGTLIVNGLARVRPSASDTDMAPQMMALELEARNGKRGLWADERYAVLTPETAERGMNGWAIVEGTVHASAMARNTIYLNFGLDWHTDFTVGITPEVRREMTKIGLNPLQFAGKKVRVRGWVEKYNGPYIEAQNPVWIEILPDTPESPNVTEEIH